jgi:pimeloyl-ACP methyl ester carboxylesterase
VAPVAATIAGRGGYVVGVSSAAVPVFDQIEFEIENTLLREGVDGRGITTALGLQRTIRRHALGAASWEEYSDLREAVRQHPTAAPFARAMPSDSDDWRWAWWARVGSFDPVDAWARADVRTLVVYGAADQADNVPVARSVERLSRLARRPGVEGQIEWKVFPGLGHALVDEASGWVSSLALARITDFVAQCPS